MIVTKSRVFSAILFLFSTCLSGQINPPVYINEFLASNVSVNADIVDFDDYSDWIELYNGGETDFDIGGYYLSDDPDNPIRWKFPAGTIIKARGFLRLWADGYNEIPGRTYWRSWLGQNAERLYFTTKYFHLNFKLSRAGEYIGLYRPDGWLVDSVSFDLQQADVSLGRQPDGSGNWYFFGEPTPEAPNTTPGVRTKEHAPDVEISPPSGFYTASQEVSFFTDSSVSFSTYTFDGAKPGSSSDTFAATIPVTATAVLKARSFEMGKLPGTVTHRTYFLNENTSLPVFSITTPPGVFWDSKSGIYPRRMADKEIPVHVEYFDTNRDSGFSMNLGLSLTGQASLYYPQVSFTLNARERYGADAINYPVFKQRELNSFTSLYLRNSGVPDNRSTLFRDAMQQSLVLNKMDIECQAYKPSVLFLNGEYWGIYNIRDKINSNYLASLHNLNPEDIDLLEYEAGIVPTVMNGNADTYNLFYQYIKNHDLSLQANYTEVENWMDIDEYINYQICEIYYDNVFWPDQNMRMWRERKEDGKWRWILFDLDFGFGMPNMYSSGYTNNTLRFATSSNLGTYKAPDWSTLIFRKLLLNDEFKTKFIQKFESYLNSVFHPDTVLAVINTLQNNISPEMPRHINRWKDGEDYYGFPISSYSSWLGNVEGMKTFARYRPAYQRNHLAEYFKLGGTSRLTIAVSDSGMGRVRINETEWVTGSASGIYFKGVPVDLEAIPEVGYKFVRWLGIEEDSLNPVRINFSTDTVNITALFDSVPVSTIPSGIFSDTVLLVSKSPYYASGDIIVDSNKTLRIEGGVEIYMPEKASIIVHGQLIIEGTPETPVLIAPNQYAKNWGTICFVDATGSSSISGLNIERASRGRNYSRDRAGISGYKSDFSLQDVSFEEVVFPVFAEYGNVYVKGCTFQSIAAGDLININYASSVIIENCDFSGNDDFDSDAIDLGAVNNAIIRGNRIYNIYGTNSDGIDLGENSKGALLEDNLIYNISDKGVSVGTGSSALVRRNILANCGEGIGIKDSGSFACVEHTTFYGNKTGLACFEKSIGEGGGTATVINSIFSQNSGPDLFYDRHSAIDVTYSLSDKDELPGTGNMQANPLLLNELRLSGNSPAINTGDPALPDDPDGSVADMGAYPYQADCQENLIINELHYNPPEGPGYAFVELVNAGASDVSLKDYQLAGDIEFTFPDKRIVPGEYFIVARDSNVFQGKGYKVFQWERGALQKNPGRVLLRNRAGELLDIVNYNSRYWWPGEPDGKGPSLELHNTNLENMVSTSWRSSYRDGGTAGKSNGSVKIDGIFINEFLAGNNTVLADETGAYSDWIEFYNSNDKAVNMAGLFLTDTLGNPCKYQLPFYSAEETTIPARGHLLYWADGQPEKGIRHLGFKLDLAGEQIGLVQVSEQDTVYLDSLTYKHQIADLSFGRFPDGTESWHEFLDPTPWQSNLWTAIEEESITNDGCTLLQNYPNPFSAKTTIRYQLIETAEVELCIYDFTGRKLVTLTGEHQLAGNYEIGWDANGLKPGIYFCELKSGNCRQVQKMILLK